MCAFKTRGVSEKCFTWSRVARLAGSLHSMLEIRPWHCLEKVSRWELGLKLKVLTVNLPRDMRRYYIVAVHYHGEGFAVVGFLERSSPTDQHVENHPQTPDINCWSIVSVPKENFWCRICQGATAGEKSLTRVKFVWEPKVGQLDHAQLFKEDHILGFQIPMNNMELVTVLDGSDNLVGKIKKLDFE